MFFLILLQLWVGSSEAAQTCVSPQRPVKGLKVFSQPREFQAFYPGELLELVQRAPPPKQQVKVRLGEAEYWLKSNNLSESERASCQMKFCVQLSSSESYRAEPKENARTVNSEGVFPVLARSESWYRVSTPAGFVWITRSQVSKSRVACGTSPVSAVAPVTSPSPASDKSWRWGIETGMILSTSGKPYDNLVTPRPDGSVNVNDDAFDSPFIEKIKDGSGFHLGLTLETPLYSPWRSRFAVGYKVRTNEFIQRPNPHLTSPSFKTYDELDTETVQIDSDFLYFNTFLKYQGWKFLGLQWQPGVLLGIDYSLTDVAVEFRTRPQKLTSYTVESGYKSIEFVYGPRVDISYSFLTLSITGFFTSYSMEPMLSLGAQF